MYVQPHYSPPHPGTESQRTHAVRNGAIGSRGHASHPSSTLTPLSHLPAHHPQSHAGSSKETVITTLSPQTAIANVASDFSVSGNNIKFPYGIAFTKSNDCSQRTNQVLGLTDTNLGTLTFSQTGEYGLCYSEDNGVSWVLQSNTATKLTVTGMLGWGVLLLTTSFLILSLAANGLANLAEFSRTYSDKKMAMLSPLCYLLCMQIGTRT